VSFTATTDMTINELQRMKNRQGVTMVQLELCYRVSGVETVWMSLATAIKAGYVKS
jgi:hypothetical protein